MSNCGNRWSGGFQGGGPVGGGGGGGGAFWLGDFLTMEAAETALTSAEPGAYADIFVGTVEIANFFGRLQHQLFGAIHHLKMISNCYVGRCGAYDNSVLDFTDPARVEIISGAFAAWNGGITTAADYEMGWHFLGAASSQWPSLFVQALLSTADVAPAHNSFFGYGLIDSAAKGTNRTMGGGGCIGSGVYPWTNSIKDDAAINKGASTSADIWSPGTMPATPARITTAVKQLLNNSQTLIATTTGSIAHATPSLGSTRYAATTGTASTFTIYGAAVLTGGATLIDHVVEVISINQMDAPAGGY